MRITVNEKEFDAISFAIGQIETEIESAEDETFIEDANNSLKHLYSIMEKCKKEREKAYYFKAVRAEVRKLNRGKRPQDIDKLTRRLMIKFYENKSEKDV